MKMPNKEKPLISVIVPIYKVEKYLNKCVKSIINQTYKNLEIILVDDGSPDNCGKICDKLAERDDRIRIIHKKNGGLSSARNAGIEIANGEYIGFVDSDDYIDNDMFETLYNNIKDNNADLSIIGYQIETIDNKVIKYFELEEKIYEYESLIRYIKSHITKEIMDDICGNCEWYSISKCKKRMLVEI